MLSKKSPQLRFKGFTDDWEDRNLKDILREFSTKSKIENEYRVLSSTNVGMEFRDGRVSGTSNLGYKIIKNGDLVLSPQNLWLGNININNIGTGLVSPSYKTFNFTDIDSSFIKPQLRTPKMLEEYKNSSTQGASVVRRNLEIDSFYQIKIATPSIKEQEKIGSFFKHLDSTISLHQRKLDLLKEQKKGYLQKMFPKNGEKVPELRFEGFTDAWELRKLNEVSDIYDGTHQTPKYQDDGVMFLSVENIKTLTSNKFISREAFEVEFKIRPQRGDVLMTRIGDIGTANVVETDEDLAYYVSLALFKSEELNPYFLQASIYAPFVQDQIWKRTLHIAFPKKINKNEIGQVPINVPTLAEQTKIGSFFKQLDNTITLHQRKLDLLKEQKKGYLQKMFPKNGEKVPELRFAGFADDWEERKLSDIADRFDNLRVPITASDRKPGDTPYYGANGIQDYVEGFTHNGEFILVAEDGANDLKNYPVQYVNGKVWVNNHAHVLQGKKTITDNKFLMNAIKNFNIEPFLVGGGRAKLNADVMMKLNILLPTFVEQEKIGSLFSLLDKTIALHQRKLDLLKEQKKGYLQKMFAK